MLESGPGSGRQWGMPRGGPRPSAAALALRSLERTSLCELELDALVEGTR